MVSARSADARCLFHRGCGGTAALDSSYTVALLRGRGASALRSRKSGRFSGENHDQTHEQGETVIERYGRATASRRGHGDRRKIARAGRADTRSRHSISKAVLRFASERLLRSQPYHRGNEALGGG